MRDNLARFPTYFPARTDKLYTLKQFLDNADTNCNGEYNLPIIVNIISLNTCGRAIKDILIKKTPLLLLKIHHINSILAEYHRLQDGRHPSYRHRLTTNQGKLSSKASTKFRTMKKLSKSLASLTTVNQPGMDSDDDKLDGDDDNTHNQRNLVRSLNEKRSSTVPLCRVPKAYGGFFELLNESDQSIEPYHKIADLMTINYDDNDSENRIEKWPHAFFLRSSCTAFTQKSGTEFVHTRTTNDYSSSATSSDSCYSSLSDLDSQKNAVTLNDETRTLQPGQILRIICDCYARRTRISEEELKVPKPPPPPPSPSRPKSRSLLSFLRKRRPSNNSETLSSEIISRQSTPGKCEAYLKCRTQQGDILFINLDECGVFSPLNCQTHRLKSNAELNQIDVSGVFQLNDLLSNFRFPISVRLIDGSISFDNAYSPATINQHESPLLQPVKLRLLMPYDERVVFACPLYASSSSKFHKTSISPIVIPLSVNTDIEIQPCINMNEISEMDSFIQLVHTCFEIIEQYETQFSLVHFPLQLTNKTNRRKQLLDKKRSQSESHIDYFDEGSKYKFRHSDEHLNNMYSQSDGSSSFQSSPLRYKDSIETIKAKLSTDNERQQTNRHSSYYIKLKVEDNAEDEIYEDVDKIYDYIRTGAVTTDVQKIQDKVQGIRSVYEDDMPCTPNSATSSKYEQQMSSMSRSPEKMRAHRFPYNLDVPRANNDDLEFHSCKNDKNVDDEEARALFLASKQRTNLNDLPHSKPIKKMKRITKH